MKNFKKSFLLLIMIFVILVPTVTFGSTIPWPLLNKYISAYEANNEPEYIKAIEELIVYYKDKPNNKEKLDIITPKLEILGLYYEKVGRVPEAIEVFEQYIPMATEQGWDHGVRFVSDKLKVLKSSQTQLYIETNEPVFYGAKHETKGIMFGKPSDSYKRYTPSKTSSIVSVYTDLKSPSLNDLNKKATSSVVLVNLNVPTPEKSNLSLAYNNATISKFAKELSNLNKPVLLRIGGEMNVWSDMATGEEFIKAYKNIADIVKKNANNVAFVWSPNDLNGYNTNMMDFYPGDNYVDWLGVSSYTLLYFLGERGHNEVTNTSFLAGDYANPIARLNNIRQLGINKPIIITEGGVGHTYPLINQNEESWAIEKLKFLYEYLPIVAPEVKAIVHFDVNVSSDKAKYQLYDKPNMISTYNALIDNKSYISNNSDKANIYYKKFEGENFTDKVVMYTYTAPVGVNKPTVKYFINGHLVHTTDQFGYRLEVGTKDLTPGEHNLEVKVFDGEKLLSTTNTKFNFKIS